MQNLDRVESKLQLTLLLKMPGAVMKTDRASLIAVKHDSAAEVLLLHQVNSF